MTLATPTAPDEAYTFSWTAFQNGAPVDQMQSLRDEVAATKRLADELISSTVGAIVAFRSSACPLGWVPVTDVSGRTIIGAGAGSGLTARVNGQTGGAEMHTLTVSELPSHSHGLNIMGRQYAGGNSGIAVVPSTTNRMPMENTGANSPHNNMPPFIVFTYCERPPS